MARFELIFDESPMEKSGNHELPGFSWDPEPEPVDVVPVFIGIFDESFEDLRLQNEKCFSKCSINMYKCNIYVFSYLIFLCNTDNTDKEFAG